MKWCYLIVAALWLAAAGPAVAGCCSASKPPCAMVQKGSCADMWAKLNLTDEQKAKLAAVQAECEKANYSPESQQKCLKVMQEVLTPEQFAQCQAECAKAGAKCCPAMSQPAK